MNERTANPMQAAVFLRDHHSPAKHHTQVSISFGERTDPAVLRQAWEAVCDTHVILRSTFSRSTIGDVTVSEAPETKTTWGQVDWTAIDSEVLSEKWEEFQNADLTLPMDGSSRITEILLPGGGSHYLLTLASYLLDEASIGRVLLDWLVALERAPAQPAEQPAPLTTTAAWSEILKSAEAPLAVHARPIEDQSVATASLTLGREQSAAFLDACKEKSLDPRAVVHSLWALMLRRLGATGNVTLGQFNARRSSDAIGYFENWLPVCHEWASKDWMRDLQRAYGAISENAWISTSSAVTAAPKQLVGDPLCVAFSWRGPEAREVIQSTFPRWINFDARIRLPRPDYQLLEVRAASQISLTLHGLPGNDAFANDLLKRITSLMEALDSMDNKPAAQVPLLLPDEIRTLKEWSRGPEGVERPANTLAAFRKVLEKSPDAIAVRDGDYELTYAELDSLSDRLAAHFAQASLVGGWHVALFLSPSSWIAIALLAAWKAGDICLALDPGAPPEWIESMLTSQDVGVVLCDAASAPLLDASSRRRIVLDQEWDGLETADLPKADLKPESPAAILPGHSDGPPPQIRALTQEMLVAAALEGARVLDFGAGDSFLAHSAPGGGAFFDEWLLPLLAGGTVQIAEDDLLDPVSGNTTHLRLTAPEWNNQAARWARAGEQIASAPRVVAVESGSNSTSALEAWDHGTDSQSRIITFFSPAGVCGLGLAAPASPEGAFLMIGRPTPEVEAFICDGDSQNVPPGFTGELWIKFPGWKKSTELRGRRGIRTGLRAWRNRQGLIQVEGPLNRFTDPSPAATRLRTLPEVVDCLLGEQAWTLESGQADGKWAVTEWPLDRGGWIDVPSLPRPELAVPTSQPARAVAAVTAVPAPKPTTPWSPVSVLQQNGSTPPLVLVPTTSGVPEVYQDFVSDLGDSRRILGLTARGAHDPDASHTTIENAAAAWIEALTEEDPTIAFDLCGFGFGGIAALEMARQLGAAKRRVPGLILIGSLPPESEQPAGWLASMKKSVFKRLAAEERVEPWPAAGEPARSHEAAWKRYRLTPCNIPARIIVPSDFPPDAAANWLSLLPSARIEPVKCTWSEMLSFPAVKRLASILASS